MKLLIRDLVHDWQVWLLFCLPGVFTVVAIILSAMFNASVTQHHLDESLDSLIHQIRLELANQRVDIARGFQERDEMRRTLEPLKRLPKEVETLKEEVGKEEVGRP